MAGELGLIAFGVRIVTIGEVKCGLGKETIMACVRKSRQVRTNNKTGPKPVRVKSHSRTKPKKCK
jgi:hypothetical protein